MSPLFSVSVCWKPRAVRGYWCEGLPALRGACFAALMSFSWLPVRAGPEPHRTVRPEKEARLEPFADLEKELDRMSHFAEE